MNSATAKVRELGERLTYLDKEKQHERAKIRDAERNLKKKDREEQEIKEELRRAESTVRACMRVFRAMRAPGGSICACFSWCYSCPTDFLSHCCGFRCLRPSTRFERAKARITYCCQPCLSWLVPPRV